MDHQLIFTPSDAPNLPTTQSNPTFPRFPALPIEIRKLIWEYALPSGRFVTMRLKPLKYTSKKWERNQKKQTKEEGHTDPVVAAGGVEGVNDTSTEEDDEGVRSILHQEFVDDCTLFAPKPSIPPPSMLFACRESSQIASRYYTRAFSAETAIPETYFDFKRDILYLRSALLLHGQPPNRFVELTQLLEYIQVISEEDLQKVENLAVELPDNDSWDGIEVYLARLLGFYFGNVKRLYIVVYHDDDAVWDDENLYLVGLNQVPDSEWGYLEGYTPEYVEFTAECVGEEECNWSSGGYRCVPEEFGFDLYKARLDKERLLENTKKWIKDDQGAAYVLPEIQLNVVFGLEFSLKLKDVASEFKKACANPGKECEDVLKKAWEIGW